MKAFVIAAACSVLLVAVMGQSRSSPQSAKAGTAGTTIGIDNFTFNSATMSVKPGTQVTWVNHDDVPHKIVSTDKKFSSPVLDTGERFSFTFTSPGTYEYFCSIHPMMKGKVVVK